MPSPITAWLSRGAAQHWLLVNADSKLIDPGACASAPELCGTAQLVQGQLGHSHYDTAVIVDPPTGSQGERMLALLRDQLASRVLLVLSSAAGWRDTELAALGYTALAWEDCQWRGFEFDLHHYKQRPDWLNPDHWAHPERWNKERW